MYEYKATLNRIIDGDTIDVNIDLGFGIQIKQRVRLHGIDTPEVRTLDLEEKKRGNAAKDRLKELLPKEFMIKTILNKRGKYGRILGIIMVPSAKMSDGYVNINEQLVTEGYAERYKTTPR